MPPQPTPSQPNPQLPPPNARGQGQARGSQRGPAKRTSHNRAATMKAMSKLTIRSQASSLPSEASQATTHLSEGASNILSDEISDDEDPDSLTITVPTTSKKGKAQKQPRKKLFWSGPMEAMMMELYIQEVEKGKRSDSGFQSTSHRHVAAELRKNFPEVDSLLDATKVKSKLSQGFKKDYDAFMACRDASGFGWDELTCEVTASDEVWERYLVSHPNARKFQGVPFPEFRKLEMIFGSSAATGEAARLISQQGLLLPPLPSPIDTNTASGENPSSSQVSSTSPSAYLSRSHSKKNPIALAIDGLVGYLKEQREQAIPMQSNTSSVSVHQPSSSRQLAIGLYQDEHADEASQHEVLQAFKILKDNDNAEIFTSIKNKALRDGWLHQQIEDMINSH